MEPAPHTAAPGSSEPFPTFAVWLMAELHHDCPTPTEGNRLVDDLGFDSLQIYAAAVVVEQAADLKEPPPQIPLLTTVGDVHDYYRYCLELRSPTPTQEITT